MMKTSLVSNARRRPLARIGLPVYFISLNLLKHWRWNDKLTAYTASWEEYKLLDSVSSSSARTNGLCKKSTEQHGCFQKITFNLKIAEVLSVIFSIGKTSTVESGVSVDECVVLFQLTKQLPYSYLWADAITKRKLGLLLKAVPSQNHG